MDVSSITILILAIYFAVLLFIGYKDSKSKCADEFIIGNRNVGIIPTISSVASSFRDGGGIAFWIGAGFAIGYGYISLIFGVCIGMILMGLVAPKIRAEAVKNNYITIGQMIKHRIGENTSKVLSLLVLILLWLGVSAQLFVIGNSLSVILDVPVILAVLSSAFVVGAYLFLGGYKTVVKTDTIQFFIIVSVIVSAFFIPLDMKDVTNFKTFDIGITANVIFFVWGILYPLGSADAYQRIFSAKNDKVVKTAFPLVGPFLLLMTLSLTYLGMSGKTFLSPDTNMNDVMYLLLDPSISSLPSWVIVLMSVAFISITMSTVDTFTYLFSSTLLEDFGKIDIVKQRKKYIKYSRICMITLLIVSSLISLTISDFIKYILSIFSFLLVFGPIMFGTSLGIMQKSEKLDFALALSLLIAATVFFVMFVTGCMGKTEYMLVPFGVCVSLVIISALVFRKKGK